MRHIAVGVAVISAVMVTGTASRIPAYTLRAQAPAENHEKDFLSRIRRLTVEGRRAGEGYWGPDGKKLVFQSEREPGNPF